MRIRDSAITHRTTGFRPLQVRQLGRRVCTPEASAAYSARSVNVIVLRGSSSFCRLQPASAPTQVVRSGRWKGLNRSAHQLPVCNAEKPGTFPSSESCGVLRARAKRTRSKTTHLFLKPSARRSGRLRVRRCLQRKTKHQATQCSHRREPGAHIFSARRTDLFSRCRG